MQHARYTHLSLLTRDLEISVQIGFHPHVLRQIIEDNYLTLHL